MDGEKLISELVYHLQQGTRQTRDGSHLEENAVKEFLEKKFAESLNKITRVSGNVIGDSDIRKSVKEFDDNLKELGVETSDRIEMVKAHRKELESLRKQQIDSIKNFIENEKKTREKYNEMLDKEAERNVARTLSNGKSDSVFRKGETLKEFGNSLHRISGGKGALSRLSAASRLAGTKLMKFAPQIGVAINGLQKLHQLIMGMWENRIQRSANASEYRVTSMDINTSQYKAESQMKLAKQSAENNMLQSSISFAKTATQALGALAQEKAGAYGQLGLEGVKIGAEGYVKSHEIAAKAPFDIKGAAYAAANAALELGGQGQMFEQNKRFTEDILGSIQRKTDAQISAARTQMREDIKLTETLTENALIRQEKAKDVQFESDVLNRDVKRNEQAFQENKAKWETNLPLISHAVYGLWGNMSHKSEQTAMSNASNERQAALRREQAEVDYNTMLKDKLAERNATVNKANAELHNMRVQNEEALQRSKIDIQRQYQNTLIESAKKINQAWMDMTQALNDEFLKMETSSMTMGREIGLTDNQLRSYSESMGQMQVSVSKWGKNLEWMQQMQGQYQEDSGRNKQFSEIDFTTTAAVGKLVGDDIVGQLNSGMEIFNTSVADSNTQFYEMYKSVSKIGLNGKKYAKDLVKNLSLAEKYNFKNGVKNLMEMSKWAQNMRFNVGSLDGMLDKVQEGGLEGVIKQAAELQVLGGNFAMGSDPLAMAYEAYMDPEAYAKRMNSMIAGQGMFDEKTGEVSFGIASQQMMRQYAQSTGQDYKDVLNQARQQVKIGQINKNLSTEQGFTEEQQSLIANKAQYNKDSQQWEVTTLDGQVKNVNELTQTDMSNLGPEQGEDSQETMVELQTKMLEKLSTIYSRQETMENSQTELKSFLMGDGEAWAKLGEANDTITQTMRDEFFKNIDTYRRQVSDNLGTIKNAPSQFFKIWKAGNKEIDDATIEIKNSVQNIDRMLPDYWKEGQEFIGKCMSSMAQGMGVNFEIPEIKMPTDHKENRTDTEYKKDKNFFRDVISPAVTGATAGAVIGSTAAAASFGLTAVGGAIIGGLIGGGAGAYDYFFGDGIVNTNGVGEKINDGAIAQNGKVTRIDDNDQVLAAKSGGPIDKMVSTFQSVMPRPMRYDSYVSENPYGNGGGQVNGDGKIEISPIQININGNIQISGGNGTTDITQQLANDPNFIRSLSQMISLEVEKKVRGGRVNSPLNRGLEF